MAALVRKTVFLFVGAGLIVFGILIIPLPGPGILFILAGLWLWGQEFAWARRWQRSLWEKVRDRFQRSNRQRESTAQPAAGSSSVPVRSDREVR